jgi:hypothetical protein
MAKFGYNSCRWIRQNWKFVTYSGRQYNSRGELIKTFSYTEKCGGRGGRFPDGRVRLCLPLKVIQKLTRSKKGRLALYQQIKAKQKAPRGERVPYNEVVAEVFDKFQKSDTFQDSEIGQGNCRPVLDESTVQLRLFR